MRIEQVPFTVIDWEREPVTEVPGKSGTAQMRTVMDDTSMRSDGRLYTGLQRRPLVRQGPHCIRHRGIIEDRIGRWT